MNDGNLTPVRLLIKLTIYFVLLFSLLIAALMTEAEILRYLPFGGTDALDGGGVAAQVEITQSRLAVAAGDRSDILTGEAIRRILLFLCSTLMFTVVVMIPITWTYSAIRYESGPSKMFVRALMVLPICASTVVLLIQDSLALAFGLAALVAAVRFRVSLDDAIDGIYIFAAICVGLAAGIGYLGVGAIMALFFCLTNAVLWYLDYGNNPIDTARLQRRREKLGRKKQDEQAAR
ncbi:MAG: DUF4956 domain-containing protein [Pseudomonadota bacterium]